MRNRVKSIYFFLAGLLLGLGSVFLSRTAEKFYHKYNPINESRPIQRFGRNNINSWFQDGLLFLKTSPKTESISRSYSTDHLKETLLKSGLSTNVDVIFRDKHYSFSTLSWFNKYVTWWITMVIDHDIYFVANSFDCDNFSDFFMVAYSFSNYNLNSNLASQLACGTVIVEQLEEFGGIQYGNGIWHSLNIVWLDEDWFIIEPQNGAYISLASYPNKKNIKAIIF